MSIEKQDTERKREIAEFAMWQMGLLKKGNPPDEPEWVDRLRLQSLRASWPTVTARTMKELVTPGEIGAAYGHKRATLTILAENSHIFSTEEDQRILESESQGIRDVVLHTVCSMDPANAEKFFKRFCRAWKRGVLTKDILPVGGKGDESTWRIVALLIDHWREVEKRTLPELCKFLTQKLPDSFQKQLQNRNASGRGSGERFQDRVKKICTRCGCPYRAKRD